MVSDELHSLDATAQADLVRRGQVSAVELVDAAIARIEALNPDLNALTQERFASARKEAETAGREGAFPGVPILLKDLGCPALGLPEYQGSLTLKRRPPDADHDCAMVRRFKGAGFVVLGRTNVPEFGVVSDTRNAAFGATSNPWNRAHSPGGSSGGSAAAVAAGMVPLAHGNDGGGSIRIPASHCGLVGLKPTRGRVSHAPDAGDPMFGHVSSGALTRSVRDTAAVLDLLSGAEPGDPTVCPPPEETFTQAVLEPERHFRIGFVAESHSGRWPTDPACVKAVTEASMLLAGLGHEIEEAHPNAMFEEAYWSMWFDALSPTVTSVVEAAQKRLGDELPGLDPITLHWASRGATMSAQHLVETLEWLDGFRRRVAGWWSAGYDLLLSPVFVSPPPLGGLFWSYPEGIEDSVGILRFTPQFNTTGQPAISVPWAWTETNLPIGVQLVAGVGKEDHLLTVARQIEIARPWSDRYPAEVAAP